MASRFNVMLNMMILSFVTFACFQITWGSSSEDVGPLTLIDSHSIDAEDPTDSSTVDSADTDSDTAIELEHPSDSETLGDVNNLSLQEEIAKLQEPDFLLIGVVKSGSTSLYHYMVQHPEITGVESTYLLPQSIRDNIDSILRGRRSGKIPRMSHKPQPQKSRNSDPGPSVKRDISEINNFDLARMMKPIIDQKEVRFFDAFWYNHLQTITNHSLLMGWKWYLETFDQRHQGVIRGEASPTYFASSQFTAERIKLWLPNVKLILLLRNPVRRLVSHLKMIKENHAANMRFRKLRKMEQEQRQQQQHMQGMDARSCSSWY